MDPPRVPLDPRRLKLRADVGDREALLELLVDTVLTAAQLPPQIRRSEILETLRKRLADRAFVAAPGLALPYARIPGLQGVRISVVTLGRPVDWYGADVAVAVMVLMPQEAPAVGLRLLDQLRALRADRTAWGRLETATDAEELARWLERRLNEDPGPLLARDLMRAPLFKIGPETPLPALTRLLTDNNLSAAGVTDEDNRLLGVITADSIFTFGMPDFFRQLQSVSFIAEFDPLRSYFTREETLTARDVMQTDVAALPPEATALEVIFALSVQGYPKVFVVDPDRRLLGIIDRMRVLDRIINL